ncbi:FMN reductase [Nocardioides mesophilus]|uniref:FMN reductase n=1 Tax=Nocardioides mesophilus TaxID=433659 RepID=A0A7G9R6W5_9ACTN|nr:FMN reductase [Nocardioides mesophilus]QNN51340.1 FMN reductase [Nocardioides mesophilus]
MTTRRIAVVSAGLSQPSSSRLLADRLAEATVRTLEAAGETAEVEVVELRELAHDITDQLLTGFPSPRLEAAQRAVAGADGLIAVTPVFSASYSGLFKSFFDVLEEGSLDGKPVLAAATGGTARHSLALDFAVRPLLGYLRAAVQPTAVFGASEDFGHGGGGTSLSGRIDRAARELAGAVLGSSPADRGAADPFADTLSFEDLLAGRVGG